MFTRVVELTSKSGKAKELSKTITEKVLPILKKQTGFVDETVLVSDTESTRVLGLSFWNSKEDAERYHREQYPKIQEMLKPLIETEPVVRTFDVHTSTPTGSPQAKLPEALGKCCQQLRPPCLRSHRDKLSSLYSQLGS